MISVGLYISPAVLALPELSISDKIILSEIEQFCGKGKVCKASQTHFSRRFDLSTKTVGRSLKKLQGAGLIEISDGYILSKLSDKMSGSQDNLSIEESGQIVHAERTICPTQPDILSSPSELRKNKEKKKDSAAAQRKANRKPKPKKLLPAEQKQIWKSWLDEILTGYPNKTGAYKAYGCWYAMKPTVVTCYAVTDYIAQIRKSERWDNLIQTGKGEIIPELVKFLGYFGQHRPEQEQQAKLRHAEEIAQDLAELNKDEAA